MYYYYYRKRLDSADRGVRLSRSHRLVLTGLSLAPLVPHRHTRQGARRRHQHVVVTSRDSLFNMMLINIIDIT